MNILKEVLSIPTAPFHEGFVAEYVKKTCSKLRLKLRSDRYGNLYVRYKKGRAKQPVIFSAHMDHPAFEVVKGGDKKCEVGILGGINLDFFRGAKVAIWTGGGIVKGVVSKRPLKKKWMGKPVFELKTKGKTKKGSFGWYDLPDYKEKNGLVFTKGADNLASTAALLELLTNLKNKLVAADVTCVFTRAEEVGFVGCVALSKQKIVKKNIPIIVLECSSAKAGKVNIGGGPVIRVGDKLSTFNNEIDTWLKKIANDIFKKDKNFHFQRALLSGGTCESSVWMIKGHKTGGLAFPLGNYHNNAEKTYAPEFISLKDYKWMLEFLLKIASAGKISKAITNAPVSILKNFRKWNKRLS